MKQKLRVTDIVATVVLIIAVLSFFSSGNSDELRPDNCKIDDVIYAAGTKITHVDDDTHFESQCQKMKGVDGEEGYAFVVTNSERSIIQDSSSANKRVCYDANDFYHKVEAVLEEEILGVRYKHECVDSRGRTFWRSTIIGEPINVDELDFMMPQVKTQSEE